MGVIKFNSFNIISCMRGKQISKSPFPLQWSGNWELSGKWVNSPDHSVIVLGVKWCSIPEENLNKKSNKKICKCIMYIYSACFSFSCLVKA